jgi:hypothetical protein
MLPTPTLDKLHGLKLPAMAQAWTEQQRNADLHALSFDERFGLLVDAEWLARENKRLARALREAKLKLPQACVEAIDYPARRELDKAVIRQLATCRWIDEPPASPDHGRHGHREKLRRLCARPPRLPPRLPRVLPPRLPALRRSQARARRWQLRPAAGQARAHRRPGPRRLGPGPRAGSGAARSARDSRGSLRQPLDDRHQSTPTRPVARPDRRADPSRCHLRSAPPQRPPARAQGAVAPQGDEA